MSEKIRSIVFADYRIQNENVPQFRSGFLLSSRAYGLKGKAPFGSKELSRADGLKGKKRHLGQKNCHGRMV